jgi:hypothetical protein
MSRSNTKQGILEMDKPITLNIFEIVGSEYCVAADDGQKVHDQIVRALKNDLKVKISFNNIERLTSAFLNVAIGQLYGEFPEELLRSNLSVTDIEPDDLDLLKRVIDTAKLYFKDPERFKVIRDRAIGEDEADE